MRSFNLASTTLIALLAGTSLLTAACDGDQGIDDGKGDDTSGGTDGGGDDGGDDGGGDDGGDDGGSSDDCGDAVDTACALPAFEEWTWFGVVYDEEISSAGDRDWFTFDAEAGYVFNFTVAHYIYEADNMMLDSVLRIYDGEGNLLATNDDMPYRFWETDSSMWFEVPETGTYFVEVLEWSDWDAESDGAEGGSGYYYELLGTVVSSPSNFETEPNNDQDECDTLYNDEEDPTSGFYAGAYDSANFSGAEYTGGPADYFTDMYGWYAEEGDVDVRRVDMSSDISNNWYVVSLYPGMYTDTTHRLSLYNSDWELLASSDDPEYKLGGSVMTDHGIAYYIPEIPEDEVWTYYVVMEAAEGDYSRGTFYQGSYVWYGYTYDEEDGDNDIYVLADSMTSSESSSFEDLWYTSGHGMLGEDDSVDYWYVDADDVGGFDGKYFSVRVMAEQIGSTADVDIVLYDEEFNELTSASDNPETSNIDAEVRDFEIDGDYDRIIIGVEAASVDADHELANFYTLGTVTYTEPVYD